MSLPAEVAAAACRVYAVGDRLVFHAMGLREGTRSMWVGTGEVSSGTIAGAPEEVGRDLLAALAASRPVRRGETHPDAADRILDLAGVPSHRALTRRARLVRARREGGVYELVPTVPARTGGGWEGPSGGVRLEDPTPEELGAALAEALAQSPTHGEAHPKPS